MKILRDGAALHQLSTFRQSLKLKVLSLSVIALLAAGGGTLVWQGPVAIPKEAQAAPA